MSEQEIKDALEAVQKNFNDYKIETNKLIVKHNELLAHSENLKTSVASLASTIQNTAICIMKFQDEIPQELKDLGILLNNFSASFSILKLKTSEVRDAE